MQGLAWYVARCRDLRLNPWKQYLRRNPEAPVLTVSTWQQGPDGGYRINIIPRACIVTDFGSDPQRIQIVENQKHDDGSAKILERPTAAAREWSRRHG